VGTTISVSGGGKTDITVFGQGTVIAGNGNDSIDIKGGGKIIIGSGHDTLTLGQGGVIVQSGAAGFDTINIGAGNATVYEQGHATISGAFGSATISGGVFEIHQSGGGSTITGGSSTGSGSTHSTGTGSGSTHSTSTGTGTTHSASTATSAHLTAIDNALRADLMSHASAYITGAAGNYTFITGTSQETMSGASGSSLFKVFSEQTGSTHVIKNFVSGENQLYVEGHTLAYLQQNHDISTHDGNTYISLGGGTSLELQGVTTLKASDIVGKH
jgi:hypothetical protein